MAFLPEEQKKAINWFGIAVAVFAVSGILAATYYLFFAPTPGIEVVVPPPLRAAHELSGITVDPTTVINSKEFRALRSYAGVAGVGELGRANPFLPL